jgi:AcrR family transcriptional regulator
MSSTKETIAMGKSAVRKGKARPARKLAGDKVFDVAAELFYRRGVRAVGVEEIVTRAGVAKISLYRNFPSKDDLVLAYLEKRNADFWLNWDMTFAKYESDPETQLDAIMTHLARRTTGPGYGGCPFVNFCAEFREPSHPGRRVAEANKREMRRRFVQIAAALDALQPEQLADGLLLLVEGAYAISQTLGGGRNGPGNALLHSAQALVDHHRRRRSRDTP